ncbi:hypothetical protein ACOME3_010141 [Neoechinorhynchus agilis]
MNVYGMEINHLFNSLKGYPYPAVVSGPQTMDYVAYPHIISLQESTEEFNTQTTNPVSAIISSAQKAVPFTKKAISNAFSKLKRNTANVKCRGKLFNEKLSPSGFDIRDLFNSLRGHEEIPAEIEYPQIDDNISYNECNFQHNDKITFIGQPNDESKIFYLHGDQYVSPTDAASLPYDINQEGSQVFGTLKLDNPAYVDTPYCSKSNEFVNNTNYSQQSVPVDLSSQLNCFKAPIYTASGSGGFGDERAVCEYMSGGSAYGKHENNYKNEYGSVGERRTRRYDKMEGEEVIEGVYTKKNDVDLYNKSRDSSPVEKDMSRTRSDSDVRKKRNSIRFSNHVRVFNAADYDRSTDKQWAHMTIDERMAVRHELNEFKNKEMYVHPESRQFTRFHRV